MDVPSTAIVESSRSHATNGGKVCPMPAFCLHRKGADVSVRLMLPLRRQLGSRPRRRQPPPEPACRACVPRSEPTPRPAFKAHAPPPARSATAASLDSEVVAVLFLPVSQRIPSHPFEEPGFSPGAPRRPLGGASSRLRSGGGTSLICSGHGPFKARITH